MFAHMDSFTGTLCTSFMTNQGNETTQLYFVPCGPHETRYIVNLGDQVNKNMPQIVQDVDRGRFVSLGPRMQLVTNRGHQSYILVP